VKRSQPENENGAKKGEERKGGILPEVTAPKQKVKSIGEIILDLYLLWKGGPHKGSSRMATPNLGGRDKEGKKGAPVWGNGKVSIVKTHRVVGSKSHAREKKRKLCPKGKKKKLLALKLQ